MRGLVWTGLMTAGLSGAAGIVPAMAQTICGHEIKLKHLVMERASKWYGPDRKEKSALGSLIAECEKDGVRYIVSSPDGKPDNRYIQGFIYRKTP